MSSEFDAMLQKTLTDRRLSGAERQALQAWLAEQELDEQQRGVFRSKAFAAARAAVASGEAAEVIDWLEGVVKLLVPRPASPANAGTSSAHFSPGDDCWQTIVTQLQHARKTVDVCVFTITDDRLARALLAAHQRGVKLRILTDNEKALDPGSDIEQLQQAGIPLRIDRSPYHMHHKFALFDDSTLLTGSYNWTRSAATSNEENFILTHDRALVQAFRRTFEDLWQQFA